MAFPHDGRAGRPHTFLLQILLLVLTSPVGWSHFAAHHEHFAVWITLMPVYMIRAGEHGPVKIGFAENVTARLVKMQADNHERLTVIRLFAGAEPEERLLHLRLADLRLHGEWFAFSRRMLGRLGSELVEIDVTAKPTAIDIKAEEAIEAISQNTVDAELGKRIRAARRAAKLTQRKLASQVGSDRSDISHYENGSYFPSSTKLLAIAGALGVTADWLMGASATPSPVGGAA